MTREYIERELEKNIYNIWIVDDLFDEVFEYFEKQKLCEDCKYWNKIPTVGHGKCAKLISYYFSGTTRKDFGCNKWKEKDTQ